jgi:hypothetical protein
MSGLKIHIAKVTLELRNHFLSLSLASFLLTFHPFENEIEPVENELESA